MLLIRYKLVLLSIRWSKIQNIKIKLNSAEENEQ